VDRERLTRLLGQPELQWLVGRVRRRMERGESLDTTVTRTGASTAERAAVARLLGRKARPGNTVTVSLSAVEDVLRRSGIAPEGLAQAVIALTGPVTLREEAAAAEERGWREAYAPLDAVVEMRQDLADWYERIRASGLVRRVAGNFADAAPLLADLAAVIRNLPADGEPLGRFAARVAGGAHALDDDRSLATLALGAARVLAGLPEGSGAQWRREVWAGVGLLRDELSATVLTLGLPGDGRTATGRALGALSEAGQPAVLTLRQLVRDAPTLALSGHVVSVCENPVVVSGAADRLGAVCAPLVCTSGQPGAAALHLLRLAQRSGASLRYHGDFDWGGIRIGNVLFDRLDVRPWRFDAAAYRDATDRHQGRELAGTPVDASWNADLRATMTTTGLAVEEELVLDELLQDLAR
jgi:uncharacterized protein (TIGR02679 family)